MDGFLVVGALGVVVLALFFWMRGRNRRTGALPMPPEARVLRRGAWPPDPAGPLHRTHEGDGGGNS